MAGNGLATIFRLHASASSPSCRNLVEKIDRTCREEAKIPADLEWIRTLLISTF
jgi:hypothetical protein